MTTNLQWQQSLSMCKRCVCVALHKSAVCLTHINNILVTLEHCVECDQVSVSLSAGIFKSLQLFFQHFLSLPRIRQLGLQNKLITIVQHKQIVNHLHCALITTKQAMRHSAVDYQTIKHKCCCVI